MNPYKANIFVHLHRANSHRIVMGGVKSNKAVEKWQKHQLKTTKRLYI